MPYYHDAVRAVIRKKHLRDEDWLSCALITMAAWRGKDYMLRGFSKEKCQPFLHRHNVKA